MTFIMHAYGAVEQLAALDTVLGLPYQNMTDVLTLILFQEGPETPQNGNICYGHEMTDLGEF